MTLRRFGKYMLWSMLLWLAGVAVAAMFGVPHVKLTISQRICQTLPEFVSGIILGRIMWGKP